MKNFRGTEFRVGDQVCLSAAAADRPSYREVARIELFLNQDSIPGGVRVAPSLEGFRYWNVSDLVFARGVPRRKRKPLF